MRATMAIFFALAAFVSTMPMHADPRGCAEDIARAAGHVARGTADIVSATKDCAFFNHSTCLNDIDHTAKALELATDEVTKAVDDCGGNATSQCGVAVDAIAGALHAATDDVSDSVYDCKKGFSLKCLEDAVSGFGSIAQVTANIVNATKVCA